MAHAHQQTPLASAHFKPMGGLPPIPYEADRYTSLAASAVCRCRKSLAAPARHIRPRPAIPFLPPTVLRGLRREHARMVNLGAVSDPRIR